MPVQVAVTAAGETTATLALSSRAADGSVDLQLSSSPEFRWVPAPTFGMPNQDGISLTGLNQRDTLYVRARARRASGAVEIWGAAAGIRTAAGAAQVTAPAAVMIEPPILMLPEPILAWQAEVPLSGFPVENLGVPSPVAAKFGRSGGAGGYYYAFYVRHAGAPVDTLALLNTNAPEAATLEIRAADTFGDLAGVGSRVSSTAFRASANLPGRAGYHGLVRLANPVAKPWWRIIVWSEVMMAGVLYAEHFAMGLRRGVDKNMSVEKRESPAWLGSLERRRSGNLDRQGGYRMRRVEFDVSFVREAQHEASLRDLIYRQGETALIVPNSKAGAFLHDRICYGDLNLNAGGAINHTAPFFSSTLACNSLI